MLCKLSAIWIAPEKAFSHASSGAQTFSLKHKGFPLAALGHYSSCLSFTKTPCRRQCMRITCSYRNGAGNIVRGKQKHWKGGKTKNFNKNIFSSVWEWKALFTPIVIHLPILMLNRCADTIGNPRSQVRSGDAVKIQKRSKYFATLFPEFKYMNCLKDFVSCLISSSENL